MAHAEILSKSTIFIWTLQRSISAVLPQISEAWLFMGRRQIPPTRTQNYLNMHLSQSRFLLRNAFCAFLLCVEVFAQATPQIIAGDDTTLVVRSDGSVWGWGDNTRGQLAEGSTGPLSALPVEVLASPDSGAARPLQVSISYDHALLLKDDGTVWAWGDNTFGQLGAGSIGGYSTLPLQINDLPPAVAVATGRSHSLVLLANGGVIAFGRNNDGQLGLGNVTNSASPQYVLGLGGVNSIAAGDYHSLAVTSDGRCFSWGRNSAGQLGLGNTSKKLSPTLVPSLSMVQQVHAGEAFSLAVNVQGQVWTWGLGLYGRLGRGSGGNTLLISPGLVPNLTGTVEKISVGTAHVLVKTSNGIYAWGDNASRQLPLEPYEVISAQLLPNTGEVIDVAAGAGHTLLLQGDGLLLAWGANGSGQLGDCAAWNVTRRYPVQKFPLSGIRSIDAGPEHAIAVNSEGAHVWGRDVSSSTDPAFYQDEAKQYPGSWGAAAAGSRHTLLLSTIGGQVYSFGSNSSGQLGSYSARTNSPGLVNPSLTGFVAVAAGDGHSVSLNGDGRVWAWGQNNYGQIGNGTNQTVWGPVQLPSFGSAPVVAIASGLFHNLALTADGRVYGWGRNTHGQLGMNYTTTGLSSPTLNPFLTGITAIAAGERHSLALKSDGTIWSWGYNASGQGGTGNTATSVLPTRVLGGFTDIVSIGAGDRHSLAVRVNGEVWAWGLNDRGQLGDGTLNNQSAPVKVQAVVNALSVGGGNSRSMALLRDGSIRVWGNEQFLPTPTRTYSAIRLITSTEDSDADILPDSWETSRLGSLSYGPLEDPDYDGLNNLQEYANSSDPLHSDKDKDRLTDLVDPFANDFFNGIVPLVTIIGGDAQLAAAGEFNQDPIEIAVWNPQNFQPFVDAPVSFSVLGLDGKLALSPTSDLSQMLVAQTDVDGVASVYFKQPTQAGLISTIRVSTGPISLSVYAGSLGAMDDNPPTVPGSLLVTALSSSTITLAWLPSDDLEGLVGYEVFVDGAYSATTSAVTVKLTNLTPSTTYSVKVRAKDVAGNMSAFTLPCAVTTLSASGTIDPYLVDSDSDGLPDGWEIERALNPNDSADATEAQVQLYLASRTIRDPRHIRPLGLVVQAP